MYAEEVKVVILGNSGVGKSSIMMRFVKDEFSTTQPTTMGAAFMSKMIKTSMQSYKFQIWDTAGQEKYKSLAPLYYRDSRIGIIVYDVTSMASFAVLKTWVAELQKQGPDNIILAIVGNKCDLTDRIEVEAVEAEAYAKEVKALFAQTSAKENSGIKEMFDKLAEKIEIMKANQESDKARNLNGNNNGGKQLKADNNQEEKKPCQC